MSQRTSPTEAGDLNRRTEEQKGRDTGSGVEFGKNIGRSEDLDANTEGGMMESKNKQQGSMGSSNLGNESTRRSGGESGYGSSSGRSSGSSGSMGSGNVSGGSNLDSNIGSKKGGSGSSSGSLGSDQGRH